MNIELNITEKELKNLVYNHLQDVLGEIQLDPTAIKILVKSKQNYRSEWEEAHFKATFNGQI